MTDIIQPSQKPTETMPLNNDIQKCDGDVNEHRQDTFDALFQQLADLFGEACEKNNINTAVFILEHPDTKQPPAVFIKGHMLEAAGITADFLRRAKTQIYKSLDTEPR